MLDSTTNLSLERTFYTHFNPQKLTEDTFDIDQSSVNFDLWKYSIMAWMIFFSVQKYIYGYLLCFGFRTPSQDQDASDMIFCYVTIFAVTNILKNF